MNHRTDVFFKRLDSVYEDNNPFEQLKARLLILVNFLLFVLVLVNFSRFFLNQPPALPLRIGINCLIALVAIVSSRMVLKGKLIFAGSSLALGLVVPVNLIFLLKPGDFYAQPLASAFQLFAFDCVVLLIAFIFSSKRTAGVGLGVMFIGNSALYLKALDTQEIAGTLRFTADTFARDGMITLGFIFMLGVSISLILEYVAKRNRRMFESIQSMNISLEKRVAERTQELKEATMEANAASVAKSEFLANMSHEIRTPLYGIIAQTEMMKNRADDFSAKDINDLNIVAESGNMLLHLINDILDFSKIEAHQMKLESSNFALAQLMQECISVVAQQAQKKQIKITTTQKGAENLNLTGDSYRIKQIILNLLSNAIKFTETDGSICVSVQARIIEDQKATVHFRITDTGIGMDEGTQRRIFERFTQADNSTTRNYGGSGLGLAISSHLVTLMGGELTAESQVGVGTTFKFSLSLPVSNETNPSADKQTLPREPLGLHVLVTEDNRVNQKIICRQLDVLGCTYITANHGAEAVEILQTTPGIQIILMDKNMPVLDGQSTTSKIRAWKDLPDASPAQRYASELPIIAFTASTIDPSSFNATHPGMTDFVLKPLKIQELYDVLERHRPRVLSE